MSILKWINNQFNTCYNETQTHKHKWTTKFPKCTYTCPNMDMYMHQCTCKCLITSFIARVSLSKQLFEFFITFDHLAIKHKKKSSITLCHTHNTTCLILHNQYRDRQTRGCTVWFHITTNSFYYSKPQYHRPQSLTTYKVFHIKTCTTMTESKRVYQITGLFHQLHTESTEKAFICLNLAAILCMWQHWWRMHFSIAKKTKSKANKIDPLYSNNSTWEREREWVYLISKCH